MEEAAEIKALIRAVVDSDGAAARSSYDRYRFILSTYQEQPQLLDSYLDGIVQPLATLLRHKALSSTAQDTESVQDICRLLHVLITVRGYKTVVRFFPHEAADLERVLQVLGYIAEVPAAAEAGNSHVVWEAKAVLLLWLSILVLIPFDLAILDSKVTSESSRTAAETAYTPLAAQIMSMCQAYLQHPGAVREMAALVLARLLTRPDMSAALQDFILWQQQALATSVGPAAVFLLPGILRTLALIYKCGRREQLLALAPQLYQQVSALLGDESGGLASNALARKLAVKLAQRIGLVLLPPQLPGWRYAKRAAADLGKNLATAVAGQGAHAAAAADTVNTPAGAATAANDDQTTVEIPEEIEDLIGVLLSSCCDRDTVVRWSAAKGVGRLAGCLPGDLAEEVVEGTLQLLSPSELDTSWHGGCLALADLARRSILSPARLPTVTALLQQALAYDVRRGPCSVGGHVRDAAAYVCWALARAYERQQLSDCVHALSASLLVMACYDREINCRRAAASAFQECVGRLGSFPHGLEILAVADYFSVGNVSSAYLRVAPFVASFSEYTAPLLEHLVAVKLRHWDKTLRSLAAMGLAALAPVAAQQLASWALPQLLQCVTDDVLEVRTGAVLGIAELLPALAAASLHCTGSLSSSGTGSETGKAAAVGGTIAWHTFCSHTTEGCLTAETAAAVVSVLIQLEAAALYRGKGGELMREAAARLVEQVAFAVAGLEVVPLVNFGPSKRLQAEMHMSQQIARQQQQQSGTGTAAEDVSSDKDDDGGDVDPSLPNQAFSCSNEQQRQQLKRARLLLPLTEQYHSAAVRLITDCLGHVQNSIQASGVAALKAHARAFQDNGQQRQQLLGLVEQLCSRLTDRNVLPAVRRGAAAGLGVLPEGLVAHQAGRMLEVLAAAAKVPVEGQQGFEVEVRMAAVASLAELTLELLAPTTPAGATAGHTPANEPTLHRPVSSQVATSSAVSGLHSRSPRPAVDVSALTETVCPALLAALEDYTRDNRGDVGSWVREATMEGLAQVVLALGRMCMQQQESEQMSLQLQQQQQCESEAATVLATGVCSLQLIQPCKLQQHPEALHSWTAAIVSQLHCRLCVLVVSGLLRQSLERIARLREAAFIHLQSLLAQTATAAVVPGAAAIAAALPGDASELAGIASLGGVAKLGGLLSLPWYRLPLLEGLVVSIGGVDASLAKAASAALLAQVQGGGSSGDVALRRDIAKLLLQLWQQEAGSIRLSLPLIKAAALLITHADFASISVPDCDSNMMTAAGAEGNVGAVPGDLQHAAAPASAAQQNASSTASSSSSSDCSFAWCVLQLLKQELRGCSDVSKLLEGSALLAQLACIPDCSAAAIQAVMVLLVNRFPKVRRHMAEQLYLQMLAVQAEDDSESSEQQPQSVFAAVSSDDLEAALDVLLISPWDGPVDQARTGREELAGHLHIEIKTRKVARASEGRNAVGPAERARSAEHESYQSLLDDAARGGGY